MKEQDLSFSMGDFMPFFRSPILNYGDFKLLLGMRLASWLGLQIQAVIVGWQIYQLRQDALLLGLVGLAEAAPAIACAFISGHIVDHGRPVTVLRLSLLVLLANSLLLLVACIPFFDFTTDTQISLLFLGVFISGAGRAFVSPSAFSLFPHTVPRQYVAQTTVWTSFMFQVASIVGPALGGLLYSWVGAVGTFALPVIFQGVALLFVAGISNASRDWRASIEQQSFLQSLRQGWEFTFKSQVLLSSMALDMFSVLFGGITAILPIYADQVLGVGAGGLGFLRTSFALGAMVVSIVLVIRPLRVLSGQMLLWCMVGFGLTTLALAFAHSFAFAALLLFSAGVFDGINVVIRHGIMQLITPDEMRGRISAVSSVFITSSNEIGAFESGLAARILGLMPSIAFGGAMTLIVVASISWLAPDLRKVRINQEGR